MVRHGYLVYERYFGRGDREALPELASCGKAFTSVAVGIMLKDKKSEIPDGLDEKVFTPKYLPSEYFPLDDPRKAQIVSLRYFAGLSVEETAAALDLSEATVKNEWKFARAWLHRALGPLDGRGGGA